MSVVIGIDPHRVSHAAAAVDETEVALAEFEVQATRSQTRELLGWAERFPQRRWAIESANGHGYLLAQQLVAAGEPWSMCLLPRQPGSEGRCGPTMARRRPSPR